MAKKLSRRQKAGLGIAVLGILMALAAGRGLHRVQFWHLDPTSALVWSAPFGSRPQDVGIAKGLDGQRYGPLAFAYAEHRFWIADSYQHRIVETGKTWRTVAVPDAVIEDLVYASRGLYFVDNQQLAVYRLLGGRVSKIIQLTVPPGQTEAIWHLAADGRNLLLEGVRLGRGQSEMWIAKYNAQGRLLGVINMARSQWDSPLQVDAAYPISAVVRSFEAGPHGWLYVEAASGDRYQREVLVYNRKDRLLRKMPVLSPEPIVHSEFLGINRLGWIYMGINLNVPGHSLVVMVTPNGRTTTLKVRTVPVKSVVYGTVGSTGSLYLLQSTNAEYRIARWNLRPGTRWVWRGPHW